MMSKKVTRRPDLYKMFYILATTGGEEKKSAIKFNYQQKFYNILKGFKFFFLGYSKYIQFCSYTSAEYFTFELIIFSII